MYELETRKYSLSTLNRINVNFNLKCVSFNEWDIRLFPIIIGVILDGISRYFLDFPSTNVIKIMIALFSESNMNNQRGPLLLMQCPLTQIYPLLHKMRAQLLLGGGLYACTISF